MRPKTLPAGHQSFGVQESQTPGMNISRAQPRKPHQAETAGRATRGTDYVCARAARMAKQRHPRSMISVYK